MLERDGERTSVVLIDNESLFCAGLCKVAAGAEHRIDVVAVEGSSESGLDAVERLTPAVVVLSAALAGTDGLAMIRSIRRKSLSTNVIVLCTRDDDETLFSAIKFGAAAYVLRTINGDDLCRVINQVATGAYLINDTVLARPLVAARILQAFRGLSERDVAPLCVPLSAREIGVLASIAQGRSNKQVGRDLHISDQTVKNHITSIMRKLAVNDRTLAVVYALQRGWITS